ncbi:MAG: DUF4198 domain-containing protein [Nitrospirales bacterium]|nr:DUF4198 domain-containing protein [Nitrospirales bacterium]
MSSVNARMVLSCAGLGIAFALGFAAQASAHFMWIETDATAHPERAQSIRLYFGEYQEFLREEAGGRLDTLDGVTLRIVDSKRVVTHVALTKKGNYFEGTLPSCMPGRYIVLAEQHEAAVQDLTKHDMGIVKPMFHGRAQFLCFEEGRVGEREPDVAVQQDFDVIPLSKGLNLAEGTLGYWPGGEIVVKVLFKGVPFAAKALLVHSPIGWDKELHTDSHGIASFTPLWPGRYVFEAEHQEKTPGEFKGKPFKAVRHRGTLGLQVMPKKATE